MELERVGGEEIRGRLIDSLARQSLFHLLAKLKKAYLVIEENGQCYRFGNEQSELHGWITVSAPEFYRRILLNGSNGAAAAYLQGEWQTPDLTKVIQVFAANLKVLDDLEQKFGWLLTPLRRFILWQRRNSVSGSRKNISAHYDLSNALYQQFLDPQMQYSSAVYASPESSLEEAQENKLQLICERLELKADDHLLEIGTGWGGLAIYAARHRGCRVTTTTISDAQHEYALARIKAERLEHKITLLKQDYRTLEGKFDKLVSIEMIEAVGHHYLPGYFRQLASLLKPGGRLLLQAITIDDRRYDSYRKNLDFIQEYVFPGGCLPSLYELNRHLKEQTRLQLVRVCDFGLDYAHTLADWRYRFEHKWPDITALGFDDYFYRLWLFYFCYCEAGFREKTISVVHYEAVQPVTVDPE